MISNRARVEGCITKAFMLKEITYFLHVYFVEEHNVNATTMWYNVDEEPSCNDLSIFALRDTTIHSSMSYYSTSEEMR
jgi:hypothetical protein